MHEHICADCGTIYREDAERCPKCGAPTAETLILGGAEQDPSAELVRTLLYQARQCQQRGAYIEALQYANDALALRPTCSSIHALIGSIYEQKGDAAAARHHFKKALTVTPPADQNGECAIPEELLAPESPMVRTVSGAWVLPALIGCLLFSGLAALFTLWPRQQAEQGTSININFRETTPRTRLRTLPRAVQPVTQTEPVTHPFQAQPDAPEQTLPDPPAPVHTPRQSAPLPVTPAPPKDKPTLGPSATRSVPVVPDNPTMQQGDEAFFQGDNERAIAIYEKLLAAGDAKNPRVHQNLAKCYNSLGNTDTARTHLHAAISGYEAIISANPVNETAQDELSSCRATLAGLDARAGTAP